MPLLGKIEVDGLGPSTPPAEAAEALYREAMSAWRNGHVEDSEVMLRMARDCALISFVTTYSQVNR
jgi:hypothetical protein